MHANANSYSPTSAAGHGETTGSAKLDLQCAREQWATVHLLRWAIDRNGLPLHKVCTCLSCPTGANTRPWPTKAELQDAGAPSNIPRDVVETSNEPAQTLSERLEGVEEPPEQTAPPQLEAVEAPPAPAQTLAQRLEAADAPPVRAQTLAERLAMSTRD